MMRSLKADSEKLIVFAYSIYIVVFILSTTEFKYVGGWTYVEKFSRVLVLGIIIYSFFVASKIASKWFVIGVVVVGIGAISYLQNGLSDLFIIIAFFIAGAHLKSEKLLKSYVLAASAVVLMTLLFYAAGIYEYNAMIRTDGTVRLYLGFNYTTYCANFLYHILLAYVALKKKEISVKETLVISFLNMIVYKWTDTNAVFFEIFLMLTILWLMRIWPRLFNGKLFRYATMWVMPLLSALSIYLSYSYDASNRIYVELNRLLSGRLSLGYAAIRKFGFSLFGHEITWVTGISTEIKSTEDYLYVDCSYLNIALVYGIVVLLLVIFGFVILGRKAGLEKKYFLCVALIMLAVHSASDPQLFELRYDPFLILLGTVILRREIPLNDGMKCRVRLLKVKLSFCRHPVSNVTVPAWKGSVCKDAFGRKEVIENEKVVKA